MRKPSAPSPAVGPMVLVIDDAPTVRDLMQRSLGKDATSCEQIVAEVRQLLTQQAELHSGSH